MARKQYDYILTDLKCTEHEHPLTRKVWKKLHYVDGYDAPVRTTVPHGSLDNIRCWCGSPVQEA